jgi:UDP-N-acetylmuramate dehydrogenase
VSALEALADRLGPLAQRDAPLGARTTYRVGGTAALLVEACSTDDLHRVADALAGDPAVPVLVVGRGSNLLVADRGFDGLAVALAGDFDAIDLPLTDTRPDTPSDAGPDVGPDAGRARPSVRAGGAVALPVLARRLADLGLAGFAWAVGVPGSVGGAVRMNAGGHGADTASVLSTAEVVDLRTGVATTRTAADLALGYRRSNLSADDVVVAATFLLDDGDADAERAEVRAIVRWRREHQPGGANCGSVFQNPPGDHAARLVEAAGLKGRRLGTAMVSPKHANFIQADRDGRADDVRALITEVRDLVERDSGVALSTEVVFVGFGAVP